MTNQNMTPKNHKFTSETSGQILDYENELNGKLISPPYTSDESGHPHHQHNLRHRNSYRASISTNNTLSSPRSSEIMGEIIFDTGKNSTDISKNYLIMNHENDKIISSKTKSLLDQNIDDLVMQRLSNSKKKRIRRIQSSSRNITSKMEMELNQQKNMLSMSSDDSNTRNYNQNSFKFTSLIDTNSEEFNSMPHSMQKKILQMIRNRQSAQKHRDKQKIERQNLIQENISLRAKIVELTNELQELRAKQLAILEQEGMLSHIKNGYRFTNYNMNTQMSNINGNVISGKRIDNINHINRNSIGNEDSQVNHHNIICNDNLLNEKSKTKIDNIGAKSQEIDCGFDFVPVDEYSNIGLWNSICDTNHVNANNGGNNNTAVNNNNITRNNNLCNQLTIHPNIDVLPWIGGVGVGGVGGVVTWSKQSNFVEDMLISSK